MADSRTPDSAMFDPQGMMGRHGASAHSHVGSGNGNGAGAPRPLQSVGMRFVLVLEGSAALQQAWPDFRQLYIEPLLRVMDRQAMGPVEMALIVIRSCDVPTNAVVEASHWTCSVAEMRHLLDVVTFMGWGLMDSAVTHGLLEAMYLQSLPTQLSSLSPGADASAAAADAGEGFPEPPMCHVLLVSASLHEANRLPVMSSLSRPKGYGAPSSNGAALRPQNAWSLMDVLCVFKDHFNMTLSILSLKDRNKERLHYFLAAWGGQAAVNDFNGFAIANKEVLTKSYIARDKGHQALISPFWQAAKEELFSAHADAMAQAAQHGRPPTPPVASSAATQQQQQQQQQQHRAPFGGMAQDTSGMARPASMGQMPTAGGPTPSSGPTPGGGAPLLPYVSPGSAPPGPPPPGGTPAAAYGTPGANANVASGSAAGAASSTPPGGWPMGTPAASAASNAVVPHAQQMPPRMGAPPAASPGVPAGVQPGTHVSSAPTQPPNAHGPPYSAPAQSAAPSAHSAAPAHAPAAPRPLVWSGALSVSLALLGHGKDAGAPLVLFNVNGESNSIQPSMVQNWPNMLTLTSSMQDNAIKTAISQYKNAQFGKLHLKITASNIDAAANYTQLVNTYGQKVFLLSHDIRNFVIAVMLKPLNLELAVPANTELAALVIPSMLFSRGS